MRTVSEHRTDHEKVDRFPSDSLERKVSRFGGEVDETLGAFPEASHPHRRDVDRHSRDRPMGSIRNRA